MKLLKVLKKKNTTDKMCNMKYILESHRIKYFSKFTRDLGFKVLFDLRNN